MKLKTKRKRYCKSSKVNVTIEKVDADAVTAFEPIVRDSPNPELY